MRKDPVVVSACVWSSRRSLLAAAVFTFVALSASLAASASTDVETGRRIARAGVPFVANEGQWDRQIAFSAQLFAGTVSITADGELRYALRAKAGENHKTRALSETLVDASRQALKRAPAGARRHPARVNYFVGDDARRHRTNVAAYERVSLGDVYPGIDVQLRATGGNVEKILTVAAGADPARIAFAVQGASRLLVDAKGELVASTAGGPVGFTAPIAFQERADGAREPVAVRYEIAADGISYGFALGDYDRTRAVVIDPVLSTTFLGGSSTDFPNAIAVGPFDGTVYVAGQTTSTNFPVLSALYPSHAADSGNDDAFVGRFSANLATLLSATYFGGNNDDVATAIAMADDGQVYVAGTTSSNNLPMTSGAVQPASPGTGQQGFALFLARELDCPCRATYFGASTGTTRLSGIARTPNFVYIGGTTSSTSLPATTSSAQAGNAGGDDAFVSRLHTNLGSMFRTTYFGGTSDDVAAAIAVHPHTGDVYIAGHTSSTSLPAVTGGGYATKNGSNDVFLARISSDLGTVRQSTYFGGGSADQAQALAIHPITNDVYASGFTDSTSLPNTSGSAQANSGGGRDAFVVRASADLRLIRSATFFGGAASGENGTALAIHPQSGDVFLAGQTSSSSLPVSTGALQPANAGSTDGYVVRFRADLSQNLQSTFFGGTGGEAVTAIAIHPLNHDVYVAGNSASATLPGSTNGEYSGNAGSVDAYITRLTPDLRLGDGTPNAFAFPVKFGALGNARVSSAPVQVTGFVGGVTARLTGSATAHLCVSSAADCTCDLNGLNAVVPYNFTAPGNYVCVNEIAGPIAGQTIVTTVHVGGGAANFVIVTGSSVAALPCTLDFDANGDLDALTDGLLLLRALFGLTGTSVTNGAIGPNAGRTTWSHLQNFFNSSCGGTFLP